MATCIATTSMCVCVVKYKCRVVTDMMLHQPSWVTNERKVASSCLYYATSLTLSPCGNALLQRALQRRHDLQLQHAEWRHSRGLSQEHHLGHEAGTDRHQSQDPLKCAIRGEEDSRGQHALCPRPGAYTRRQEQCAWSNYRVLGHQEMGGMGFV